LQEDFAVANQSLLEKQHIVLRIGVNLGDVIVEGSDIFGDGVNMAARLEGLAEPGGIYVSASVQEQVSGKLSLAFDDVIRAGRGRLIIVKPETIRSLAEEAT
jgi:adenylate cyclase